VTGVGGDSADGFGPGVSLGPIPLSGSMVISGQYRGASRSNISVTDQDGMDDVWGPVAFFRVNERLLTLYRPSENSTGNMTDASKVAMLSFLCGAVIAKCAPTLLRQAKKSESSETSATYDSTDSRMAGKRTGLFRSALVKWDSAKPRTKPTRRAKLHTETPNQ
jgi:hypothetical protein